MNDYPMMQQESTTSNGVMSDYQFMQYASTEANGARGYFQAFSSLDDQAQALTDKIERPLHRRRNIMFAISFFPLLAVAFLLTKPLQWHVVNTGGSDGLIKFLEVLWLILLWVALIYGAITIYKREWSFDYALRKKLFSGKLEEIQNRQNAIMQDYDGYLSHCHYLPHIPTEYANPDTLERLVYYFKSLRAHTIAEAINLFEVEMHQYRLEAGQQEMLYMQHQTYHAANRAARNAGIAAAFSLASYLTK